MNTEVHLAVGWLLANLAAPEDRRARALVTLSALAPDVDALSFFFGPAAYSEYHHTVGHNIFFSLAFSALAIWLSRSHRLRILLLTQIGFYTHYFGDYFLTRFELVYFWPISNRPFIYSYGIGLDHPINLGLGYASFVGFVLMAMWFKRTPIEMVSIELDRRIVNLFRRKPLACHVCGGKANEMCVDCGQPTCVRHGRVTKRFAVRCSECAEAKTAAARLPP